MNTLRNTSPSFALQFACFALPAIIISTLPQTTMLDTTWYAIAGAVLIWVVATVYATIQAKKGLTGISWMNLSVISIIGGITYLASKEGIVMQTMAWLYVVPLLAHIFILFGFRSRKHPMPNLKTPPDKKLMWGAPTVASNKGKPNTPKFFADSDMQEENSLRGEQKLIAEETKFTHAKTTKNFQNKAELTKLNFKAISGMDSQKTYLYDAYKEMFASFTSHAEKRNGILMFGEPGNGKTFFAECLAGQIGWPLIKATFGDMNSKWVGETTENIMRLFDEAMEQAPCVLFIDEIDALLVKRNLITQAESETGKTVNTILTKLVEVRDHMVLVVAATNYINRLDDAAIREGRFDYKLEIQPPDMTARVGLLHAGLKKNAATAVVDPEVITRIAKRWEGFSVARIKSVTFEAAKIAKAEKRDIDFACLMSALRVAQGSLGVMLPENTKTLPQMKYDDDIYDALTGLAVRMRDIDEIERLGGSVPSGVLFYGPPGTGKTATVRALAKTSGWALLTTSGKDLNATEGAVDEIYSKARNLRPCIVFIDEAEDIFARRDTSWNSTMTNKMLSVMDGAGGKSHDILWVAATNSPESIDSAALRGGRFTEKIEFRLPSLRVVEEFVTEWDKINPASLDALLTHKRIAQLLYGQSLANIDAVLQASVNTMINRTATKQDARVVTDGDMAIAIKSVITQE